MSILKIKQNKCDGCQKMVDGVFSVSPYKICGVCYSRPIGGFPEEIQKALLISQEEVRARDWQCFAAHPELKSVMPEYMAELEAWAGKRLPDEFPETLDPLMLI